MNLTDDEIRVKCAEAMNFDLHVIMKRGDYYRPGACGYTRSIQEAWKLPKVEAKKYEMYADRSDVSFCEKVLIEPAPLPDYLGSVDAALTLCDRLREEGWCLQITYGVTDKWTVTFYKGAGRFYGAADPSLARAICLAFLKTQQPTEQETR